MPQFQNESLCKTECDLHENEPSGESHMLNGFALRPILTQRQKATRKWPIIVHNSFSSHLFYLFQYYFFNINAEKLFSDIRLCVVRKILNHTHKAGSWDLLGVL